VNKTSMLKAATAAAFGLLASAVVASAAGASSIPASHGDTTGQAAGAGALSLQISPAVNAPVAVLSTGSNNGRVSQAPTSTTGAEGRNSRTGAGGVGDPFALTGLSSWTCVPSGDAVRGASTGQAAGAGALSLQISPAVNAPVAVLSTGSNNGRVSQAPTSTTGAEGRNSRTGAGGVGDPFALTGLSSWTCVPSGDAVRGASTGQAAGAGALSLQISPAVNAPVAVLSTGSNNGRVSQAPTSTTGAEGRNSSSGTEPTNRRPTRPAPAPASGPAPAPGPRTAPASGPAPAPGPRTAPASGPAPAPQSAPCPGAPSLAAASTGQLAAGGTIGVQVAPTVNVPVSILATGSNNGPVTQSPTAGSSAAAQNNAASGVALS
jgi:Meckel syndrome type 1 protein